MRVAPVTTFVGSILVLRANGQCPRRLLVHPDASRNHRSRCCMTHLISFLIFRNQSLTTKIRARESAVQPSPVVRLRARDEGACPSTTLSGGASRPREREFPISEGGRKGKNANGGSGLEGPLEGQKGRPTSSAPLSPASRPRGSATISHTSISLLLTNGEIRLRTTAASHPFAKCIG